MENFNDVKLRPSSSPVANSSANGRMLSFNAFGQASLDDIGGELLAGSGFEKEEPDSEFAPAGEES
jgi:hypothetical protein